jgi:hypothetical protein
MVGAWPLPCYHGRAGSSHSSLRQVSECRAREGLARLLMASAAFGRVASVPPRPLLPGLACLRRQYVEVPLLGTRDVGSHDAHIGRVLE